MERLDLLRDLQDALAESLATLPGGSGVESIGSNHRGHVFTLLNFREQSCPAGPGPDPVQAPAGPDNSA